MGLMDKIGNQIQNVQQKVSEAAGEVAQKGAEVTAGIASELRGIGGVADRIESNGMLASDVFSDLAPNSVLSDTQQKLSLLQQNLSDVLNEPATSLNANPEGLIQVAEAGMEFLISSASELLKGDVGSDIRQMSVMLDTLKDAKSQTMDQLKEKLAEGGETIRKMAESAKQKVGLAPAFSVANTIGAVAATTAVVGVAIPITMAKIGSEVAMNSARVAVETAASIAPVTTSILAATALLSVEAVQQLPNVLHAMGVEDSAVKALVDSPEMKILLTCALAGASAVSASASKAASSFPEMAVNVARIGVSVAGFAVEQELQKMQSEVQALQGELGELNVAVKSLMQEIESLRENEDNVKERVNEQSEMTQQIMANLEKAASALSELRDATKIP